MTRSETTTPKEVSSSVQENRPDLLPSPPETGANDEAEALNDSAEELLVDGQEEVFSRTEVESGRMEHHAGEERPQGQSQPKSENRQ